MVQAQSDYVLAASIGVCTRRRQPQERGGGLYTPVILCPLPAIKYTGLTGILGLDESMVATMAVDMSSLASRPGSWQEMQLTDPPCTGARLAVNFTVDTSLGGFYSRENIAISSFEGTRLGRLRTVATEFKHDV